MHVSQARIDANRRNALRSTGPRTAEGKARSRANALKHGLCASVVVVEDIDLVQQRSTALSQALKPHTEWHAWLVDKVALYTIRVDRAERIERRARDKVSLRAELTWEDDRKLEAEVLGRSLSRDPAGTVEALRKTPQGCEWLMTRWALLAHTADMNQGWDAEQTQMAFDLLATPHAFRTGRKPGTSLDFHGNVLPFEADPAAVARREVDELLLRREVVAGLDEVDRALACNDLINDGDPELRRLRRYEAMLHGRIRWCLKQLKDDSPNRAADPKFRPVWVNDPEAPLKPEPKTADEVAAESWRPGDTSPPFDLEPDEFPEPGQTADVPAILKSRKEKRARKAQSIREARRRKLDQLRA